MSWNFAEIGTRSAVAKKLADSKQYSDQSQCAAAREFVIAQLSQPGSYGSNGVKISASGHSDVSGVGSMSISIENINLSLDEPVAPAVTASTEPTTT